MQSAESTFSPKQKVVTNHKKIDKKPTSEIPTEFPLIIHGKGTEDKKPFENTNSSSSKKKDYDENYQSISECFLNKDINFDSRNDLYACGIGLNPTLKTGLERERTSPSVMHFTPNQTLREKTFSPKSCNLPGETTFKSKTLSNILKINDNKTFRSLPQLYSTNLYKLFLYSISRSNTVCST